MSMDSAAPETVAAALEAATPSKLLQSNLSLGVATVGLTARLNTVILGLQKTQDSLQTMGTSMVQSNLMLAKTLKDQAVSIEGLAGGVGHNSSKIGAFKGELKQFKEWVKWALGGTRTQGEYAQETAAAVQALHKGLVPVLNANNKILDEQLESLQHTMNLMVGGLNQLCVNTQGAQEGPGMSMAAGAGFPPPAPSTPAFPLSTPPAPPVMRPPVNVPMPTELVSQLRANMPGYGNSRAPMASDPPAPKAVGPLPGENAPGASGFARPPSTPMQMFKHVFFVGDPGQLVNGPLVGTPVPNMQHETTHSIRSVSPTPQEQTQACGWPGALSPKGWAIAARLEVCPFTIWFAVFSCSNDGCR